MLAKHDKAAIKKILMERDDDTAEEAQERIDACQQEIADMVGDDYRIMGLMGLWDCVKMHFDLEPDYLSTFLEN